MTTNKENIFVSIEEMNAQDYPLIFTRYLYSKEDVIHSLFMALLDKNCDEALFWAYELYYSGFQEETLEQLLKFYNEIYEKCNSVIFKTFIMKHYHSWYETKNDCIVGTIAWNLCYSNYDIYNFIEFYFTQSLKENETMKQKVNKNAKLRLIMNDNDIEIYKTISHLQGLGWKVLPQVCRYKVHREVSTLYKTTYIDFINEFHYHWLYYASFSPIWKGRLSKYNYRICDETKSVAMNDDNEDEFYSLYSYTPDEQSLEMQNQILGNDIAQFTIEDFCDKYIMSKQSNK
jgi:hypothetical protein